MLYPIIRRVRRPLLPVEDVRLVAPVPSVVAPEVPTATAESVNRTDKDKMDEHEQSDVGTETAGNGGAPTTADVPASAPAMELALTEEPAVSAGFAGNSRTNTDA